jgi:hypothetical protein
MGFAAPAGLRRTHMSKRRTGQRGSSDHGADLLAGDRLISEAETAAILGIAQRTLQQWRRKGGGPPFIRLTVDDRSVQASRCAWLGDGTAPPAQSVNLESGMTISHAIATGVKQERG